MTTVSSCISHKERTIAAIIREDYYRLLNCDEVGAALLNVFEYWANGAIARTGDMESESINIGIKKIADFEKMTLWQATDKTIRAKLRELEESGYISIENHKGKFCNEMAFIFHAGMLNHALSQVDWSLPLRRLRELNPKRQKATVNKPDVAVNKPPLATVNKPDVAVNKPPLATVNKPSDYIQENISLYKEREEFPPTAVFPSQAKPEPPQEQNTTVATLPIDAEMVIETEKPSSSAIIPACENHSQNRAADRIRQTWQETGVIPKIPMELDAWAIADIGQEVIFAYRRSGRISTISRGDINPAFPAYVSSLNPGKDIDYGYTYIKKLEADPRNWETLSSLVLKWQATVKTGDRNLNVVREVNRPSGPPIALNL